MAPQQHLDPLSALDAAFLLQERPAAHMHIGGVMIFRGPPPPFEQVLEHVRARLDRVPRYRQKLAYPPAGLGRPRWIDDPTFNLEYHVRHAGLAAPGGAEALRRLVARQFSQRLDRNKPLWELSVVEGFDDDRFALVSKTHHAVIDGVSGVDIATALLDLEPQTPPRTSTSPWVPRPEPSGAELAAIAVNGNLRDVAALPVRALGTLADRTRLRQVAGGVGQAAMTIVRAAPSSPLNVAIGPHRRVAFVGAELEDFKTIKNALGGTVNDVVLAATAGAIRHWMHARGLRTEGLELRAAVPVSLRAPGDGDGGGGNRITQLVAPLPVDVGDPRARLRVVQQAMSGLKESRQALGAELIAGVQEFAPPTILAQSTRVNFSARAYNLLVTNIPGPQVPLYLLGHELDELFPLAFLAGDRALAVAVMSYRGQVGFGLIGDYDALPDLDLVAIGLKQSIAEYLALASAPAKRARRAAPRRSRSASTRRAKKG